MESVDIEIKTILSELDTLGINNTKVNAYFENKREKGGMLTREEYLEQLKELLEKEKTKQYQSQIRKRILKRRIK